MRKLKLNLWLLFSRADVTAADATALGESERAWRAQIEAPRGACRATDVTLDWPGAAYRAEPGELLQPVPKSSAADDVRASLREMVKIITDAPHVRYMDDIGDVRGTVACRERSLLLGMT